MYVGIYFQDSTFLVQSLSRYRMEVSRVDVTWRYVVSKGVSKSGVIQVSSYSLSEFSL